MSTPETKNGKERTLDEVCGNPPGTFQKYLTEKEEFLRKQDQIRADRVKSATSVQQSSMSWAA